VRTIRASGASTSPPPFRSDAAPPSGFCPAYERQSNYAAARGGLGLIEQLLEALAVVA